MKTTKGPLQQNIEQSVKILRKYRQAAIDRKNATAKSEIETVMRTLQGLVRLAFIERDNA